jgi:hypothetical protein
MIALNFSCSKKESYPIPCASFSFTALGNKFQWDADGISGKRGAYISKVTTTGTNADTCYYLSALFDSTNNLIMLRINTVRMAIGTYTLSTTVTTTSRSPYHYCNLGSSSWGSTHAGDFATVTITKIHNGMFADGTFSATMSCMIGSTCATKLAITNGQFKNVQFFPF